MRQIEKTNGQKSDLQHRLSLGRKMEFTVTKLLHVRQLGKSYNGQLQRSWHFHSGDLLIEINISLYFINKASV